MVEQTANSDITIDEILAELASIASVPKQEPWEITIRDLSDRTELDHSKAKYLIEKLYSEGRLERRKVRCENGAVMYAYTPSGEDKLKGWKKILDFLK